MVRYAKPALLDRLGPSHRVIEASAGTGKTYTLEHLIVQLLLEPVPLENILVVTYTRKAALELTARVRAKLTELVTLPVDRKPADAPFWDLGEAELELLRRARTNFDRASISTIHAFCKQVLDDAAFEGGHLFRQENASSEELFDRAFTTLLRTDFAKAQGGLLKVALETQGKEALANLKKLLREALKEAANLDVPRFDDLGAYLQAFPEDLARAFLQGTGELRSAFPAGHDALATLLEELLKRRAGALACGNPASFWASGALPDGLEALRAGLGRDAALLAEAVGALANLKGILVAAFLPPLQRELKRHKLEAGLYDFDDMINLVVEALDSPQGPSLAGRLQERFRVALIDEFQDTDRQQWKIFRRIFLGGTGHRLFLVGDPKQAIYGFRGGDLPTYVEALEEVQARTGDAPLHLRVNFRSTPSVIESYNALFEATAGAPFFSEANAGHYHEPVTCGKPSLRLSDADGRDLPALRAVDVLTHGSAKQVNFRAAAALAKALKATLDQGRFNGLEGRTRLLPEDVYVLTAKTREGKVMAQALKAEGIPSAMYRQDGLFDGPEAEACRDLLLAIEAPFDETLRARALLGPFFGLSFQEAEHARELPEGHPILARLFGWRELALKGRFGELFSRLVSESGLSRRLLFLDEKHRTLTNVTHILELLLQQALAGHCTLNDLAVQVQRWIDGEDRPAVEDGATQRLERQGGAVQILTMHKAKGLQAPVVILFGGTSPSGSGPVHRYHQDGVRRAWVGDVKAAPSAVQGLITQEELEEGERLAYVALTRAEAQLLLPRYVAGPRGPGRNYDPEGNPKAGCYRNINQRLQALLGSAAAPTPQPGMERIPPVEEDPGPPARTFPPWILEQPALPDLPDFQALRKLGRPAWLFNYTGLQKGKERARAEGGTFEEGREHAPATGPGGGKKFGTQVHAFLERVDPATFEGLDLEAWLALPATARLADACLPLEGRRDALRWAYAAMARPLALPGGGSVVLAQAEELLRELDFLTTYPGRPDFLNGSIDVLFQAGGRAHVLDWKTNRLDAFDPATLDRTVRADYWLQVMIYAVTTCRFLEIADAAHYERAFGGVVYVFLRGLPEAGVWTCRPTWEELRAWERELDDLQPEQWIPAHAGGESHV